MKTDTTQSANIPPRRFLTREEGAEWLGLSVEGFVALGIPYCDFGPRSKRWDVVDIIAHAEQTKTCDSARTSEIERKGRICVSTDAKAHRNGGQRGGTRTDNATVKALGLRIKN